MTGLFWDMVISALLPAFLFALVAWDTGEPFRVGLFFIFWAFLFVGNKVADLLFEVIKVAWKRDFLSDYTDLETGRWRQK